MVKTPKELINENKELSSKDKKDIISFIDFVSPELTTQRILKYTFSLRKFKPFLKVDYRDANENDIRRAITELNNSNNYAERTKLDFRVCIKRFYKWLKGNNRHYPKEVDWIKTTEKRQDKKLPEELLTEDDIEILIDACNSIRDKCIVMVLYESGCRIGEFISLRKKDVVFDNDGVLLNIPKGKTGARRIRLVASTPYLSNWISNHPLKDKNSSLWVNNSIKRKKKELGVGGIRKILIELKDRTNIDKPLNPHNFRHSRATFLATKLKESQLCKYMGWIIGSKMPQIYIHLSQRDVDDAILGIYGHREKQDIKSKLTPVDCPRCKRKIEKDSNLCSFCGLPLSDKGEEIMKVNTELEFDAFLEYLKNKGIKISFDVKD